MLMPAVGSVLALMTRATCRSWRPIDVFGKTVLMAGLTDWRAVRVCKALERVSEAALTSVKPRSSERMESKAVRRAVFCAEVKPGASFKGRTFARGVFESAMASGRAFAPVTERLMAPMVTARGNGGGPVKGPLVAAARAPPP